MSTKELTDSLNQILTFLHDSQICYQDHIDHVKNPELKNLFQSLSFSRKRMISEIESDILSIGGTPKKSGTLLGQTHRVYENLKTNLTKGDPLVIAKEIRRGESILIQYYQEAIKQNLPANIKLHLITHLDEIENNLKEVDKLAPFS